MTYIHSPAGRLSVVVDNAGIVSYEIGEGLDPRAASRHLAFLARLLFVDAIRTPETATAAPDAPFAERVRLASVAIDAVDNDDNTKDLYWEGAKAALEAAGVPELLERLTHPMAFLSPPGPETTATWVEEKPRPEATDGD